MKRILVICAAVLFILSSCKFKGVTAPVETPTPSFTSTYTATPIPTPTATYPPHLQISGEVKTCYYNTQTGTAPYYAWTGFPVTVNIFVSVSDKATPVADATVTINSSPMTYAGVSGAYGSYSSAYFSAATYSVVVTYKGNAYSAACSGGGYVNLEPDGTSAAWGTTGNTKILQVKAGSLVTFEANPMTVSPLAIPASAYPYPGYQYQAVTFIGNSENFTGMTYPDFGVLTVGNMEVWNYYP